MNIHCHLQNRYTKLSNTIQSHNCYETKQKCLAQMEDVCKQQDLLLYDENTEDYCVTIKADSIIKFIVANSVYSIDIINLWERMLKEWATNWEMKELKALAKTDIFMQEVWFIPNTEYN